MLKKIYVSELIATWKKFQQMNLLFPFYSSHQQARDHYFAAVKNGKGYRISTGTSELWFVKNEMVEGWQITNLLCLPNSNWQQGIQSLEKAARQQFKQQLALTFEATPILEHWLLSKGYSFTEGQWQKKLIYHTGLVLGGGGARGAYQIGVWQALLEKNIQFELIAGTSVGGLNGALIAQGDYPQAVALWEEIETDKVLEVTFNEVEEIDFSAQVQQLRTFLRTSMKQRGVSSRPLKHLLSEHLVPQKIKTGVPFYIVTTKISAFQEVVISLNHSPASEIIDWLLASAAFFPVMAMAKIGTDYYVDGGYRNNLPVDVALNHQKLTELVIVDVHGPGFDKRYHLPEAVAEIKLASSWSLGDLFLFQQSRSAKNRLLGYLETKKTLGDLQGVRYSFENQADFAVLTKAFIRYSQKQVTLDLEELVPKLQKFFHQSFPIELMSQFFLEFFAYWTRVSPLKSYTLAEFIQIVLRQFELPEPIVAADYSVQEQIEGFIESNNVFSVYRHIVQLAQQPSAFARTYRRWPVQTLLALFINYLQEEV
ncbi:patatin-like phospholipase family protein [Enterococcus hermanniensis]|uniref:PNPLA domain-containing protein n=1 Tax=Enterococcus hermanniensis TaxID=249189 RepID=A0A1L8TME7_9ENTE|nr:patatin-like phospholipase family protein [Enterococcus hermanniensis]OJG45476.1 hypothetical protein RV04_GL002192 [Enterococcus hermanniensis]